MSTAVSVMFFGVKEVAGRITAYAPYRADFSQQLKHTLFSVRLKKVRTIFDNRKKA